MMVFPITLRCTEKGWSAYEFREAFFAAKPDGVSYYGYDTIIHSRTEVEFVVYDMRDAFYGGIGKEQIRFTTSVSPDITVRAIESKIRLVAQEQREQELAEQEERIISAYMDSIRSQLK